MTTDDERVPGAAAGGPAFVRSNGLDLCYETFGAPDDPPLLLIMGLGTQMLGWPAGFCERLAARGHRVIRFDNRDIGRSTWLDDEDVPSPLALFTKAKLGLKITVPYTLKDMARDAVGLLDALGIDRAHVVGASMGGMIGQEMAIDHADRMRTFTSIMSSTGDPKLPGPSDEALALMTAKPAETEDAFVASFGAMMKVLRAGEFPADEALDAERARATWARGHHPAGAARQLGAIFASGNRTRALAAVRVPTLVIHGRPDPLVRVEAGIATAAAIPGATLVLLDRLGHAIPVELWDALVDAIAVHAAAHAR